MRASVLQDRSPQEDIPEVFVPSRIEDNRGGGSGRDLDADRRAANDGEYPLELRVCLSMGLPG